MSTLAGIEPSSFRAGRLVPFHRANWKQLKILVQPLGYMTPRSKSNKSNGALETEVSHMTANVIEGKSLDLESNHQLIGTRNLCTFLSFSLSYHLWNTQK